MNSYPIHSAIRSLVDEARALNGRFRSPAPEILERFARIEDPPGAYKVQLSALYPHNAGQDESDF